MRPELNRARAIALAAICAWLVGCTTTSPTNPASGSPGVGGDGAAPSVDVPAGWTRILVPQLDGISTVGRVADGPGGAVAIADFSAWASADARTWAATSIQIENPRAVVATPDGGWLAAGFRVLADSASSAGATSASAGATAGTAGTTSGTNSSSAAPQGPAATSACQAGPLVGAAFSSSPDGRTWTPAPDDPSLRTYFVGELAHDADGWWAVGSNSCSELMPVRSQAFFSADGRAWQATAAPVTSGLMFGVAALGDRLVAVGTTSDDPALPAHATAWTLATGGNEWSTPVTVTTEAATLTQVVVTGGAAYAWGAGADAIWRSTDLATWTKLPFPNGRPRDLAVVTTASGSWLAATAAAGIFGLRADGTWIRLAGGTDNIRAITAGPHGLVALGSTAEGRGVAWLGPTTPP